MEIAGEIEDGAAIDHGVPGFWRRKPGCAVDAERLIERGKRFRRDQAADHALAVIGLEAVHPHVGVRQPVPDRQQQAGDDVKAALGEFRNRGAFGFPQFRKFFACGRAPVRVLEAFDAERLAAHWPDQPGADFDVAVVVHQAGGMDLHRRPMRLLVDQQTAALSPQRQRIGKCQRMIAVLAQYPVTACLGAGRGISADSPPLGDREAFGDQGLDADIVGA